MSDFTTDITFDGKDYELTADIDEGGNMIFNPYEEDYDFEEPTFYNHTLYDSEGNNFEPNKSQLDEINEKLCFLYWDGYGE